MENCIFCDREKIKTKIVYEDEKIIAFFDADPINEGHILLIPKEHYADADDIPDELLAHISQVSKRIIRALKKVYSPDGYSVMQNGGKFNDIGHFHLHIFPRNNGDSFGWRFGGNTTLPDAKTVERLRDIIEVF
ncbi:MAG: HIT family protein [Clostridia bacterium]|nr:HIT family protein [Clostridia bacterium]